jgi:hypothetical protein
MALTFSSIADIIITFYFGAKKNFFAVKTQIKCHRLTNFAIKIPYMIKNHILHVEDLIEYKIRGIISPAAMHYLAWELNKHFDLNLQRTEDHQINPKKKASSHILFLEKILDDSDLFLLQNKGVGGWILPKHQMVDAILLERNYDGDFIPNFLEKIQTPSIQRCLDIDYMDLSNADRRNIEIG